MRLLFTGRGSSGSWEIRGRQLGQSLGATIKQGATLADCKAHDLIVVVKRVNEETLAAIRVAGKPWVYDLLDFYPQPGCGAWSQDESIGWVRSKLKHLKPNAILWPNTKMREDCDTGRPGMVLRHHHLPGIAINPIRPTVRTVGYEGATVYLDGWRPAIARECEQRGWQFVENPPHLADLDIVLALRGGQWDSYPARNWKSNVKIANAHGSGTPFVGQQEAGYMETATGAEYWTAEPGGLATCFNWLEPQATREEVSRRFREKAYTLDQAAADLKAFLCGV